MDFFKFVQYRILYCGVASYMDFLLEMCSVLKIIPLAKSKVVTGGRV